MRTLVERLALGCAVIAIAVTSSACRIGASTTPAPTFCDGIDSQMGGCDVDRAVFTGTTCDQIGHEFGRQLNDRLLKIYAGPDVVNQETKAVRSGNYLSVTMSLANLHVRQLGLVKTCGADEFMTAAEAEFSADLKAQAGTYLADGPAVPYETWLQTVRDFAQLIDLEEDAPVPSF